jgi:hypothetical protein
MYIAKAAAFSRLPSATGECITASSSLNLSKSSLRVRFARLAYNGIFQRAVYLPRTDAARTFGAGHTAPV